MFDLKLLHQKDEEHNWKYKSSVDNHPESIFFVSFLELYATYGAIFFSFNLKFFLHNNFSLRNVVETSNPGNNDQ